MHLCHCYGKKIDTFGNLPESPRAKADGAFGKTKLGFLLVFSVCIIMSGCSKGNLSSMQNSMPKVQTQVAGNDALRDEDFIIRDEETYIKLGDKYENLITGETLISFSDVTEKRAYESYVYESFAVAVMQEILEITIASSTLETARGIRVGDTMEKVIEKYGEVEFHETNDATGYYLYGHGAKHVQFYFDSSNKVCFIIIDIL